MFSLLVLALVLIRAFVSCLKTVKGSLKALVSAMATADWQRMSQEQVRENHAVQQQGTTRLPQLPVKLQLEANIFHSPLATLTIIHGIYT